jgi:small-conductance mechanosensitive channel
LQQRAALSLRAVGALVFTEDLTARLHAELTEEVGRISLSGKVRSLGESLGGLVKRIWNTELYIAEDSVIAGGQKVSIPRSITLGKVVIALSIFAFGLWAACGVYRLLRRFGRSCLKQSEQAADVPAKSVGTLLAVISLLVAMASVRIPWTVFAFLGGALAIGAGFGAQALINNFISGLILLCERSLRVGDIVEVDEQRGKVMRIGFRNSLVERGDGIEVLVPNSQFLEKKVVNWTLTSDLVRYALPVSVPYGTAPGRVTELIRQAADEHPHVTKTPAPDVLLNDFGATGMVFTLQFWMHLSPAVDGGHVRSELRHRIHMLLQQAGIDFAAAPRELHLGATRPLDIRLVHSPMIPRAMDLGPKQPGLACYAGRI